jgi:MFS family permease
MSSRATESHSGAFPPAATWQLVGVIWLGMVLNYVDRQVAFSIYPVLRHDLGFSDAQLGLVGTVFLWTYSLVNPFAGRLADLMRRENLMTAGVVLWSIAALGTASSQSPLQFLFWRAGMGLTEAVYVPSALSLIGTAHPGNTRSRALSLYSTGQMVGIVAGGWFGGWMAPVLGWRLGYALLAAMGLAFAPVFRKLLGNHPAEERVAGPSGSGGVFSSRSYVALAAAFFLLCALLWTVYAWLPEFLFRRYGLTLAQAGLVATAYTQSGSVAGLLTGGYLADRMARRFRPARFYIAAIGLALAAPCVALTFSATQLGVLKFASAGFGFCSALFAGNVFAAAYDVIPPNRYGFGGGAINMIGGISGGAAMFAAGYWTKVGAEGFARYTAVVALVTAIALFFVARRHFGADRKRAGLTT